MLPSKKLVVDCLTSCFGSEQAGGFECAENSGEPWLDLNPDISEIGDSEFVFHLGNECFRVRVSKWREAKR